MRPLPGAARCIVVWPRSSSSPNCALGTWPWPPGTATTRRLTRWTRRRRSRASRGAPAAAAELLDMAIELGGDTPERRIRSARDHFNAGDAVRARALLQTSVPTSGPIAAEALTLLGVVEILEGSRAVAASLLQRALDECGDNLALRVQILVPLALALFNDHQREAAANRIDEAVAAATQLGEPHLLSEALSTQVSLGCWSGRGVDQAALKRALELEDPDAVTSIFTRPSMHNAVLLAFTGQLDEASEAMRSISADCDLRGEESEQIIVAVHRVLIEIWRGNFTQASVIAEDALERARLLDGDLPRAGALTMRAAVAAYVGRPDQARRDAQEAQPAVQASGAVFMTALPRHRGGVLGGVPWQPRGGAVRVGSPVVDLRSRVDRDLLRRIHSRCGGGDGCAGSAR